MKQLKIPVLLADQEPVLAGRLDGKRAFVRALEAIPPLTAPTHIFLDFFGAELATSSFLSEIALPLRNHLRMRRPPGYVVLANLSDKIREELEELLNRSGDALLVCNISKNGEISNVELLGQLEHKLLETFNLIQKKRETTAVELHSESSESRGVGVTAWNNRLSVLANKSLVMEIPQGRTKKYRAVLEIV